VIRSVGWYYVRGGVRGGMSRRMGLARLRLGRDGCALQWDDVICYAQFDDGK
jgi:hypothetical protein